MTNHWSGERFEPEFVFFRFLESAAKVDDFARGRATVQSERKRDKLVECLELCENLVKMRQMKQNTKLSRLFSQL